MAEVETDSKFDDLINSALIDIKAIMLLMEKKSGFYSQIRRKFTESDDRDVRLFLQIVSEKRRRSDFKGIVISIAEIALAFFLILFGISVMAPGLTGVDSFTGLISFYTGFETALHGALPFAMVLLVDLFISIILLISAFYTIRESAIALRQSGLREKKF
ncbi:MAG: hypothetical protein M1267_02875 [Candidatus Thermoplasmatota archaeon]|nr:hypothetical protein [Candidatus Thermoplasmatota archaeon]